MTGTGKTATLIRLATDLIAQGVEANQIGYISFTRQAVREAGFRIRQATGAPAESFQGFRTLHSTTFWLLGKKSHEITDFLEMSDISFLPKHLKGTVERARTKMYAQMYGVCRVSGRSLESMWEGYASPTSGTFEDFTEWIKLYEEHKGVQKKQDFIDLIAEFVKKGQPYPYEYLFLDEAQDFSPDQWEAVKLLAKYSKKVFVAGDSDQAVFGWSGGRSIMFDEIEGERRVLSQSHRVPKLPFILADRVLQSFGRRTLYRPTETLGHVVQIFYDELSSLPLDSGESWFFLCRNNFAVESVGRWLFNRRIYYRPVSASQDSEDSITRKIKYIRWYEEALLKGTLGGARRAKLMREEGTNVDQALADSKDWWDAFDTWDVETGDYLRQTRASWDSPRVFVGTFHASKGAEADNVVLYADCTARISLLVEKNDPEEHRAIYVAMTRTKKNLYLVQKTGKDGIEWSKFQRLPEDLTNGLL